MGSKSRHQFVPREFTVPTALVTEAFTLRILTIDDVEKDFEAVTSSAVHVSTVWPESDWPQGLTLRQNLIDLGWHEKEFQNRSSFAYTVVSPDESRVLGCVYIYPTLRAGYDAEIFMWVRASELAGGLDATLFEVVQAWLVSDWCFEHPAYPGRAIAWNEWNALPQK